MLDRPAKKKGRKASRKAARKSLRELSAQVARRPVPRLPHAGKPFFVSPPPPRVVPDGHGMAMDDANGWAGWANAQYGAQGGGLDNQAFLGYPFLAELSQRPEYRRVAEVYSTESTRAWIEIKSKGNNRPKSKANAVRGRDADQNDRITKLVDAVTRYKLRDIFRQALAQDCFFGRGHIYVDLGEADKELSATDPAELKTSIGDGRNAASKAKISRGSLKRFCTVEAVWCYPSAYDSQDPLRADWYNPQTWFVQGKEVHKSRLMTLIGRPVSDLLKPAYAFGGLSMSQLVQPYVENFLRTRSNVADIVSSFSVFVLKTNLGESLQADGEGVFERATVFNLNRDNTGLFVIDKDNEDFANVSAPLGTLDALQRQTVEHICMASGIPVIKYCGIQPSGMNASSEGELQAWGETVLAYQEAVVRDPLQSALDFIQLSEFGDVDDDIVFVFEPLEEMNEKERAEVRKIDAETDTILVDVGAISTEEVRQRIAADPDAPYEGLDPDDMPELRQEEEEGLTVPSPGKKGGGGTGV